MLMLIPCAKLYPTDTVTDIDPFEGHAQPVPRKHTIPVLDGNHCISRVADIDQKGGLHALGRTGDGNGLRKTLASFLDLVVECAGTGSQLERGALARDRETTYRGLVEA